MDASPPTSLFDPVLPYDSHWLAVPGGHELYVEQSGSPGGKALLLVHGGPGSAATAMQRRFFDPTRYRIVQFDQRGCGRSRSPQPLRHNHSAALMDDIERIRARLGIDRWLVCGGSWGATLAACYAAAHRGAVAGLLLRALFLSGRADLEWFFGGAGALYPDEWQRFLDRHQMDLEKLFKPLIETSLSDFIAVITPDVEAAWIAAYTVLADTMVAGKDKAA